MACYKSEPRKDMTMTHPKVIFLDIDKGLTKIAHFPVNSLFLDYWLLQGSHSLVVRVPTAKFEGFGFNPQ